MRRSVLNRRSTQRGEDRKGQTSDSQLLSRILLLRDPSQRPVGIAKLAEVGRGGDHRPISSSRVPRRGIFTAGHNRENFVGHEPWGSTSLPHCVPDGDCGDKGVWRKRHVFELPTSDRGGV